MKPAGIVIITFLILSFQLCQASAATYTECFQNTCAMITVPDQADPNTDFEVLVEGYIEDSSPWDTSAYALLEDAVWSYDDGHMVKSSGIILDSKGFHWGGSFSKKYIFNRPPGPFVLTFVFGSRSWQHDYYDVAAEAKIDTSTSVTAVAFDVKPLSCPNPLKANRRGLLSAAIVGSEELDVTQIDPSTVLVSGVSPIHYSYEDVTEPYFPLTGKTSDMACTTAGPDGHLDLTLKFKAQEIYAALQEGLDQNIVNSQNLLVTMTADMLVEAGDNSPTAISGEDIIIIRARDSK